jgi:hypothetical protein
MYFLTENRLLQQTLSQAMVNMLTMMHYNAELSFDFATEK